MRRRDFITAVGGAAAWPLAARAQQPERVRRIGVLAAGAANDPETQARHTALEQTLTQLGWSEGRNIHIDYRYLGTDLQLAAQMIKEVAALSPDVISTSTTPMTIAMQQETATVPIVFVNVSDPVGSRIVATLARPGGNTTGLLLYEDGIVGKWLGMIREIAPNVVRVAMLANPRTTPFEYFLHAANAAATSLTVEIVPKRVENAADIESAIQSFAGQPNNALLFPADATTTYNRDLIVRLVAQARLPAAYAFRYFVAAGGLMSYGVDSVDQYRQVARYVDRILRGAKPADLPVEAPTKYETVVNLKAAKLLGLDIPPSLLVRADEVIE